MTKSNWIVLGGAFLAAIVFCGCSDSEEGTAPSGGGGSTPGFSLSSAAFKQGQAIPKKYSYDGEKCSPPLSWSGAPEGTKEFALIVEDPDAGNPAFVHWVICKIPASAGELKENAGNQDRPAGPAGSAQGDNTAGGTGYFPPDPPPGNPHRYFFHLYALGEELNVRPRISRDDLLKAMEGKVLGKTELMGTYKRD